MVGRALECGKCWLLSMIVESGGSRRLYGQERESQQMMPDVFCRSATNDEVSPLLTVTLDYITYPDFSRPFCLICLC